MLTSGQPVEISFGETIDAASTASRSARRPVPRPWLHRHPGQWLRRRGLQRPRRPARRHRPLHLRPLRHRRDALLSHRHHRTARRHAGALRNLSRAKDALPEGAADRRLPRRGPAHLSRGRPARRPSPRAGSVRPISTNFIAGRTPPPDASASSRSRPNGPRRRATSSGSLPKEWSPPSDTRRPTRAQIADAVSAGATLSTHLGNGAHALLRRHPNYIWDQLAEDRLMADFIVDGIHLDASFLKVALRAKTLDRSVLITDAATPAGRRPDGIVSAIRMSISRPTAASCSPEPIAWQAAPFAWTAASRT